MRIGVIGADHSKEIFDHVSNYGRLCEMGHISDYIT